MKNIKNDISQSEIRSFILWRKKNINGAITARTIPYKMLSNLKITYGMESYSVSAKGI